MFVSYEIPWCIDIMDSYFCCWYLGSYRAAVPSGASTGIYEALELRDKDPKRFLGKGNMVFLVYKTQVWFGNSEEQFNILMKKVKIGKESHVQGVW